MRTKIPFPAFIKMFFWAYQIDAQSIINTITVQIRCWRERPINSQGLRILSTISMKVLVSFGDSIASAVTFNVTPRAQASPRALISLTCRSN